jgi:hypothetical protein
LAIAGGAFVILMVGCLAPFWFTKKKPRDAAKTPSEETVEDNSTGIS